MGPYLSERQWGIVREDYSEAVMPGTTSLTIKIGAHRWGEEGLAGISDDHQRLCSSVADGAREFFC